MSEILKPLIDFILKDSGYVLSLILGFIIGHWLRDSDRTKNLDFLRNWIEDLRKKVTQQTDDIAKLDAENAKFKLLLGEALARLVDEGPTVGDAYSNSGSVPVSAEMSDPSRGLEQKIESVLEPEEKAYEQREDWKEVWKEMTTRLLAVGISEQDIGLLNDSMRERKMGLVDAQGRERLRYLDGDKKRTPVAICSFQGTKNHRVLLPDGTDRKALVIALKAIPRLS